MSTQNRELVFAGLFIALGVVVPILFHQIGLGQVFLPMFLPILLCGFFLNPYIALIVGLITPYVSSFMTGMPPLFPFAVMISFEGAALAGSASMLFNRFKKNIWISLFSALIIQRIILVLFIFAVAPFFELPERLLSITVITSGLPGVILQIIIVPVFVSRLKVYLIKNEAVI